MNRATAKSKFRTFCWNSRILAGEDFLTIKCTCGHGRKLRPYEKIMCGRGEPCVHPCNGKTSKHRFVHGFMTLRFPWSMNELSVLAQEKRVTVVRSHPGVETF